MYDIALYSYSTRENRLQKQLELFSRFVVKVFHLKGYAKIGLRMVV